MNRLLIGNLNINSVSNKFDQLKFFGRDINIFFITETKLDSTSQFLIKGYSEPNRFDRNRNGGDVLIYVQEVIPSKSLTDHKLTQDIEKTFAESNLRKNNGLLFGSYHPPTHLANQMSISFIMLIIV